MTEETEDTNKRQHIPLHQLYRDLLIKVELEEDDEPVFEKGEKAGLQCIIWGALYLEALINFYCHEMITQAVIGDENSASAIWKLVKYSKLNEKIDFLLDFKKLSSTLHKSNIKQVNEIFELRNRLVHFKEPYFESDEESHMIFRFYEDGEYEIYQNKVYSPIELKLRQKEFVSWKQQILDAGTWLEMCVERKIQKELYDEYYEGGRLNELEEKYGPNLTIFWELDIKEYVELRSTGKLEVIIEKYDSKLDISIYGRFEKEETLAMILNWAKENPERLPINFEDLHPTILEIYENQKMKAKKEE